MKQTQVVITALCICYLAEASVLQSLSSMMLASVTFLSMNTETLGFFGFFRRRKASPTSAMLPSRLEETSAIPSGPVFPFSQGSSGFNSFSSGGSFGDQRFGNNLQQQQFRQQMARQMTQQQIPSHVQEQVFQQMQRESDGMQNFESFEPGQDPGSPGMNAEEAESFFTLLAETDESQCISRLICEMGADPSRAGEFGQTITEIIGNLRNFPPGTKAAHYNQIMRTGRQRGVSACAATFSACDNESLDVVRNAQSSDR